ncbi:MAG: hypothetical protein LUE98_20485 [Tannerellaceae bacterium]|nr:hypothetical protein [Tannerellaceae bacterium]
MNYDFALQPYKKYKRVQLGEIADEDLQMILRRLEINKDSISPSLYLLLKNFNHLDIFCRIYKGNPLLLNIRSIQDLYRELWKQLVNSGDVRIDGEKISQLLFKIMDVLYKQQSISAPLGNLEEKYPVELSFLKSKGIIKDISGSVQFFHQTFYEYVFSRYFVETNKDLISYIRKYNCSFLVRLTVKMVMSNLSATNHPEYIRVLRFVICNHSVRFHLKSLVISILANVENPSMEEQNFFKQIIYPDWKYCLHFLSNVISKRWTQWLISEGYLNKLYEMQPTRQDLLVEKSNWLSTFLLGLPWNKDYIPFSLREREMRGVISALLRMNLETNAGDIFTFINSLSLENKKSVATYILYFYKAWNEALAYNLFRSCIDAQDSFNYYNILENIAVVNPDLVFEEFGKVLIDDCLKFNGNERDSYDKKELLDKLYTLWPERSVDFLLKVVIAVIDSQKHIWKDEDNKGFITDSIFLYVNAIEEGGLSNGGADCVFKKLIKWLRELRIVNYTYYDNFIERYSKSDYLSVLRLVMCIMNNPESGKEEAVIWIAERLYHADL